jgi:hypothetical protein
VAFATGLAIATAEEAKTLARLSAAMAPYRNALLVCVNIIPRFVGVALQSHATNRTSETPVKRITTSGTL